MKLALFILPLVAAAPIPGYNWWSSDSYSSKDYSPAHPAPQPEPAPVPQEQPAPEPQPEPEAVPEQPEPAQPEEPEAAPAPTIPSVYQNSTDWWVPGTVLHGKWREGQWDGEDNTAGVLMYVDERNVAVTIVPI